MINEKRPAQLLQYLLRVREATMHQLIDHFNYRNGKSAMTWTNQSLADRQAAA
ncbi:hypothetical protein PO124_27535 [Bacillus licheniformis]|nr:hypothetical protein [Bacillus licheniformis]